MRFNLPTDVIDLAPVSAPADGAPAEATAARLRATLHAAAVLAGDADLDLDAWMQAAWTAYVEHRPGLRAHLEEVQLANRLAELRQRGQVGQA